MQNKIIKTVDIGEKRIEIVQGDITEESVDAIVNAANSHLQHGGGIAGAIVRKGGYIIQEESNKIGYVPTGSAVYTGAGNLPARYVIHAVGPVWGSGNEEKLLRSAVRSALVVAEKLNLKSISVPAISSGIFGYPKKDACRVIFREVKDFLEKDAHSVDTIRLCAIDNPTVQAFLEAMEG